MKQLTSRFKKSLFSEKSLRSLHLSKSLILLMTVGCALKSDDALKPSEVEETQSATRKLIEKKEDPLAEITLYHPTSFIKSVPLVRLETSFCKKGEDRSLKMTIPLSSEVGRTEIIATRSLKPQQDLTPWTIAAHHSQFQINHPGLLTSEHLAAICQSVEKATPTHLLSTEDPFRKDLQDFIATVSPDCQLSLDEESSWQCSLPSLSSDQAIKELAQLKANMIKKWSRQPYILTRRMTVTKQFAYALAEEEADQSIDRLCKIFDRSLDVELPVVFTSQTWRHKVCAGENIDKRLITAKVGLKKSLQELQFLYTIAEKSSRVGVLQVKIPRDQAPSKDLWVSLTPSKDAPAGMKEAIEDLTIELAGGQKDKKASCWHPLFDGLQTNLKIARQLGLTQFSNHQGCSPSKESDEQEKNHALTYMVDGITGETEFIVSNGRSKILRLPAGQYHYTIRDVPKSLETWVTEPANAETSGEIKWATRRPNALIKAW